ncbi:ring-1,2-phenylacetyl-CoA epoxidase subunit PaaC [Nakamurella panacisegetis]|uniref:Ring-1,2-phenylacetyl-CoA epoxidase subunit PaaC n=1 Tax=Nakamurella panacisegetis TaxID=1090615 RepID=A0A1H0NG43_9ACTN|nr:1,2-phenylacetyl-CoA epoxidase subunit PaaC [Nakamurella panacisegetis]SDO91722.1 ring-1,2-phenylacetyl-CoA epoxidase subunit PaaC [Nakamurella panacisegetis]
MSDSLEDDFAAHALSEETEDHRWAFGTGFTDALQGVDTTVPADVDGQALATYCLMLGDDALILSHRLQQWMTRAPELEEETAIGNIALDLLGQARMLLARAGKADGTDRDEDRFAFWRAEREFRNVRLVERADADFAEMVARLLVFSTWRLAQFEALRTSRDPVLAAIAAKGVKELTYHRDYAARWVVRLGDGTAESHRRMQAGFEAIWPLVDELFRPHPVETSLPAVAVDAAGLRDGVDVILDTVLATATLDRPDARPLAGVRGQYGRDGLHTEAFGYILAELQSVARAHPDATW